MSSALGANTTSTTPVDLRHHIRERERDREKRDREKREERREKREERREKRKREEREMQKKKSKGRRKEVFRSEPEFSDVLFESARVYREVLRGTELLGVHKDG
jgi:hypothetical protein